MYEAPRPCIRKALGTFQEQRGAREAPCSRRGGGAREEASQVPGPKSSVLSVCLFRVSLFLCYFHTPLRSAMLPSLLSALCLFLPNLPPNPRPKALLRTPPSLLWVPFPWPPPPLCSLSIRLPLSSLLPVSQDELGCQGLGGVESPGLHGMSFGAVVLIGPHQKGEHSRPFPAGAAPPSALLLHTPAPHSQPAVPAGGCPASERPAGQQGSRDANAREDGSQRPSLPFPGPLPQGAC